MCAYNNESIAEMNIHENLVNLASIVEDTLRIFNDVVNNLTKENVDLKKLYERILVPKNRVEENKIIFMEYLVRLGETIAYKQSYASIALGLERLAQYLDGASYRLVLLKKEDEFLNNDLYKYIDGLRKVINEQFNNLYQGLKKLRVEPKKTISLVNEISKLENRADEIYREATYTIYTKLSGKTLLLMMMRDVLDFMENSSDLLRSLGEELRYLALHKIIVG